MMKTTFAIFALIFCLGIESPAASASAAGVLIYTDYPSHYVEACEYATLDSGPVYSTIARPDGKEIQVSNGGLWVKIDYPAAMQEGTKEAATANLANIQKLLQQYPQCKALLSGAQSKWQTAMTTAKEPPKVAAAPVIAPPQTANAPATNTPQATSAPAADAQGGGLSITTRDGTKYDHVTISASDGLGLTLETDSGILRVSLEELPKELQQRFHYDAAKAALLRDAEWGHDYAAALARAKAANKLVLLDFTGSDWCPWCMKMKAETLDQQAFLDYAVKNLVLVELDFPNNVPQSESLKAQNAALKEKFKPEGFPTFVLVDKYGGVVERTFGYQEGGPAPFIAWISKSRKP